MTINSRSEPAQTGGLSGQHVLGMMVGFFAVLFAVNGYFLFAALSTHTGVVAIEPYRIGLAYNDRIAADERQTARGWQDRLEVTTSGLITVIVRDQSGATVSGLKMTTTIARPSTAQFDHKAELREQLDGQYTAQISRLDAGNWIATVEAREVASGEPVFRSRRRVWLKP